jgi:sec-independent protein translocase protein TatA
MPFVSPGHIWLILLLLVGVLIVRGPGKLPEVGAGLGRAMREFNRARTDVVDSVVRSPSEATTGPAHSASVEDSAGTSASPGGPALPGNGLPDGLTAR